MTNAGKQRATSLAGPSDMGPLTGPAVMDLEERLRAVEGCLAALTEERHALSLEKAENDRRIMAQALQAPEDERDPVNQEDLSNTESGIDWSSSTSSSAFALFTERQQAHHNHGPSADAKLWGPKDFLRHAERAVQVLSSQAQLIAAADSASALRSALAPDGFAMRVMMSARRQAVESSVEHVRKLLAESACGEPGEECLCGWPVRSINEWGVAQDRILILTTHALWRVHYVQEWAGVIDHHSRVSLGLVRGVRRRGAQGGGITLQLAKRDGRANPLTELKRRGSRMLGSAAAAAAAAYLSPPNSARVYERHYSAVQPGGEAETGAEVAQKLAIAAAAAQNMLAAIESCRRLHHGAVGCTTALAQPPSIALVSAEAQPPSIALVSAEGAM